MPANLNNPFGESCCDGGGTSGHESAQSCGCDMGLKDGPHYCERHELERRLAEAEACIENLTAAIRGPQE